MTKGSINLPVTHDDRVHGLDFEARFPPAYGMWDSSGKVIDRILQRYSGIQVREASPNRVVVDTEESHSVTWELDRLHIGTVQMEAVEVNDAIGSWAPVCADVLKLLEVKEFRRVGLRIQFVLGMENDEAVGSVRAKFSSQLNSTIEIGSQTWNLDDLELRLRYAAEGVAFRLSVEPGGYGPNREAIASIPKQFLNPEQPRSNSGLRFDADCFTTGPVHSDQFDPLRWMKAQIHRIQEISEALYGEDINVLGK